MQPIADPVCELCGERLASGYTVADGVAACGDCRRMEPLFAKAAAYGSYDSGLRELIHLLKYEQVRPAANLLGRMLAEAMETLAPHFTGTAPLVVPVPLHRDKLRERGFNQSELIARAALKRRPGGCELELRPGMLERVRPTLSQTGLTRAQRVENMRGAFSAAEDVAGREVLLVDDVFTTGTTVSECARVLRRAGASRVWVATVARVLKAEPTFAEPPAEEQQEEMQRPRVKALAAGV
jgi:ComF family protein